MREATTLVINTEINIQLGEFTIKKNFTRPLGEDMKASDDFKTVFQNKIIKDVIQCADVRNTTNRQWVRLIGMGYDLQLWNVDSRPMKHGLLKPYSQCKDMWVRNTMDLWENSVLRGIEFYMTADDISSADRVVLAGYVPVAKATAVVQEKSKDSKGKKGEEEEEVKEPEQLGQLKEVIVYRYPAMLHIYNVVEYGRRFYRTLIPRHEDGVFHHARQANSVLRRPHHPSGEDHFSCHRKRYFERGG